MKTTNRDEKQKKEYLNRLNIIKGQVSGIYNMIENDTYCIQIIDQVNSIRSSLQAVIKKLINEHIVGCVAHSDNLDESLDEIKTLIERISK